jgi:hypothetical protein
MLISARSSFGSGIQGGRELFQVKGPFAAAGFLELFNGSNGLFIAHESCRVARPSVHTTRLLAWHSRHTEEREAGSAAPTDGSRAQSIRALGL